jgi:hypothetical protein
MTVKFIVATAVALFVLVPLGTTPPAGAQDAKAPQPKGVKTSNLVSSTGPYRTPAAIPVVLSGQTVELEPGGQTGKMRFLVPSFIYVVDGVLTTNTEGGPVGVSGVQYFGEGQSYTSPVGLWLNMTNSGQKPVKFIQLFVTTPGGPPTEQAKADE